MIALVAAAFLAVPASAAAYTFPAGKQGHVVFSADDGSQFDIWAINADGSGGVNLTNTPASDELDPAFSADGRKIYFARADTTQLDIWVMNADGTGGVNLTNTPAPLDEGRLAPSPDGRTLAFSRDNGATWDVLMAATDPRTGVIVAPPTPLASTPGSDELDPAWTPDGRSLLISRNDPASGLILRVDPGTGAVLNGNVTSPPAASADLYPAVSPDGELLTFTRLSTAPVSFDVFTARLDGSGVANLTNTASPLQELTPRFLADGSGIVFTNINGAGDLDIYSIKLDGSSRIPLTPTPALDERDPAVESIQRCGKRRATIVGDDGPDKIRGTKKADVIVANGGKDTLKGRGGKDRICGGAGKDKISGGGGNDRCIGGKGKDTGSCEKGKL